MNTKGFITVTIFAMIVIVAIAMADFFMARILGIRVDQVPLFAVTIVRLLMLAGVIYALYKFFGSRG